MNRRWSLTIGIMFLAAVAGVATVGPLGDSGTQTREPSAGLAIASSGPACYDGNVSDTPPLRLISGTDDTSVAFETVLLHDGDTRPDLQLDHVGNATYRLSIDTERRPGVETARTETPTLTGGECQIATRVNVTGRMSNPVETLRIVIDEREVRTVDFDADGRRIGFPETIRLDNRSTDPPTDERTNG